MRVVGGASAEEVHGRARKIIEENYGKDSASARRDQEVITWNWSWRSCIWSTGKVTRVDGYHGRSSVLPKELFSSMLAKIYKRTK